MDIGLDVRHLTLGIVEEVELEARLPMTPFELRLRVVRKQKRSTELVVRLLHSFATIF